jgi:catechol 2,3-dioxygenase-like lactoylglutathione lyase family enzyme
MELVNNYVEVGLTVSDLERSLAFYRDLLGFQPVAEVPLGWGGTLHILRHGDAVVKLGTHDATPSAKNPPGGPQGGVGLRWITFWVRDVVGLVGAISSAGYDVPGPVNADYPEVKFAMVADPDGNWIELVEPVG